MRINRSNQIWAVFLLGLIALPFSTMRLLAQECQAWSSSPFGIIKIISARKMSDEESRTRRIKDYIRATYIVRLRFEATANHGVFVYAPNCAEPGGYLLERKAGKVRWLASIGNTDPSKSPGFKAYEDELGSCWLLMRPGSAYEWEKASEPLFDKENARSIFVKGERDSEPIELISPWYSTLTDRNEPAEKR
jgi:hypothetical protein